MNLAAIIEGHPDDALAFLSRGKPTTYGELRDQVGRLRGGLAALGIEPGDRVAILSANNWFFVVSYLAVLGAGAIAVPLNPASPSAEIRNELVAIGARVAIVGPSGRDAMAGIGQGATRVEHVIVPDGVELAAATPLERLLGHEPVPMVERAPDDVAVLIFTAGTSGSPKAAMLSHGNLLANLEQMQAHPGRALTAADVSLGVLPMFHIFGLNVALGITLARGATIVLVQRFDPSTALDTIRERKVTVVPGAPPLWLAFSHFDAVPPGTFDSVRLALTGAAKMPEEAMRNLEQRFGIQLAEGYGLTEASPVVTSSAGLPLKPGSVGKALDGVQVRLVDESGGEALVGDTGEIWVKGPNVFQGYYGDPEQTARVLTEDGWLRTGDIAMADQDGYLYLVDRAKDLIIVSGFNVYPAEVEEVLAAHPGVAEVGVIGVPHPHHGEAVKAFVVAAEGTHLDEDQLIDWCLDHLARYKCPSKVIFVDELPRNLSGKLLRRELI
jgi:long-chain acyl-CoA synthetase